MNLNLKIFAPLLSFDSLNLSILLFITFVTNNNEKKCNWVVRLSYFKKNVFPFIQMFKAVRISYIKGQCTTVNSSVIRITQTLIFLLTCCIPNLKNYLFTINFYFL